MSDDDGDEQDSTMSERLLLLLNDVGEHCMGLHREDSFVFLAAVCAQLEATMRAQYSDLGVDEQLTRIRAIALSADPLLKLFEREVAQA
jgi:hypothetical protein